MYALRSVSRPKDTLPINHRLLVVDLAMRLGAASRKFLFLSALLVIFLVSGRVPFVHSQARVGEIVLTPTHAVPDTIVSFQGVGWNLPWEVGGQHVTCQVSGEPVKNDKRYTGCELGGMQPGGKFNPVGSFAVANVTPGTYKIYVIIDMGPYVYPPLAESIDFTVDAAQPIPEFPFPALVLLSSLVLTYAISSRRKSRLN
jgi:hypothetical protein